MVLWGTPLHTNVSPDLQSFTATQNYVGTTTKVSHEPLSFGASYTVMFEFK